MQIWSTCEACKKPMFRDPKVRACSAKCGRELSSKRSGPNILGGVVPDPQPPTVRASRRQERQVAAQLGGKVQNASGSLPGRGGDVLMLGRHVLCELKRTDAPTFTLDARLLDKIAREAADQGCQPGVVVDLRDPVLMGSRRLVVMEFEVLERLLGGGE